MLKGSSGCQTLLLDTTMHMRITQAEIQLAREPKLMRQFLLTAIGLCRALARLPDANYCRRCALSHNRPYTIIVQFFHGAIYIALVSTACIVGCEDILVSTFSHTFASSVMSLDEATGRLVLNFRSCVTCMSTRMGSLNLLATITVHSRGSEAMTFLWMCLFAELDGMSKLEGGRA